MSNSDKINPQNPLTTPAEGEDETIIDLVDEIDEPSPTNVLSPLERQLLNIGEEIPAAEESPIELADLEDFDFEEEDPSAGNLPELTPAVGESDSTLSKEDLNWLYNPGTDTPSAETEKSLGASTREHERSAGFEEQFPKAEDILKVATPLADATDSGSEDDDIELLEIEDDEIDDEIVWFDDLDKELPSAEAKLEAGADAEPLFDPDPNLQPESSAADIFAAHVESGLTAAAGAIPAAPLPPEAAPAEAFSSLLPPLALPSETPIAPGTSGLSAEQIEAAVERVLERQLGGTLQSIIRQAIEAAVSKEIQRLKALLLEDDAGDRTS